MIVAKGLYCPVQEIYVQILQAISKKGFWFKIKLISPVVGGGFHFQTAVILKYVEDLEIESNAEFGPKNFFEMACNRYDDIMGDTWRRM